MDPIWRGFSTRHPVLRTEPIWLLAICSGRIGPNSVVIGVFLLHANLLIRRWKTSSPVAGMWNFVDTGSGLEIRNHLKLTLQLALHFQLRAGGKSFECMRIFFFNGGFKF